MQKRHKKINSIVDSSKDIGYIPGEGRLCMLGSIHSDQQCPICGNRFKDDHRRGLFCPDHPNQYATRFVVRFASITRRFTDYLSAQRFLTGLRFENDQDTFDPRDFRQDRPLGFSTLANQWLLIKKGEIKKRSFTNVRNYITRAITAWETKNIKTIGYAEIEDLLIEARKSGLSPKSVSNMKSVLHSFWTWLLNRQVINLAQMPKFPATPFELGFRKTINKATQETILQEVHRISYSVNPKIWLGIRWLSIYISIRPGELVRIKEQDIDTHQGYITIPSPKEKKPKIVPILPQDAEIVRSLPKGFPELPFFRHLPGISGCTAGEPFGEKYFYKWWKKACANLGIEGVDLYGGTRHSSARALRQYRTPEEIKRATMHSTNKAFERYFQIEAEDLRGIYQDAEADNGLITKKRGGQGGTPKAKILKIMEMKKR